VSDAGQPLTCEHQAFGAQTTLLILTGIMCGVAAAATLAPGMRQLPHDCGPGNLQAINRSAATTARAGPPA
jgi:hypothetical protein